MDIQKRNNIVSGVLILVILVLAYWLYHAITDPYKKVEERQQMTQMVHTRMSNVRDALIKYKNVKGHFPPNLDSLVVFLKTDSTMVALGGKMFGKTVGTYNPDSLVYSPQPPHPRFSYARNDSIRPELYQLLDPQDSSNVIGSLTKTTDLNAASWE